MRGRKQILLEINARVWLREQAWAGETPDLAQIPDEQIQHWAGLGLDWIWFMGVWEPSPRSREICLSHEALRREFQEHVSPVSVDALDRAIVGSPYAVRGYKLNPALGGPDSLAILRDRLNKFGIRLMLDFVPNHTATDHPWVTEHPDYYVGGTEADLTARPLDFFRSPEGRIIAHGRDPYFAPWTDTAQLNYFNSAAREAILQAMSSVAAQCDGLRCDMAMLVTNAVFAKTWSAPSLNPNFNPNLNLNLNLNPSLPLPEFWPAAISSIRRSRPDFVFMAEVYWDMESQLQQMGFDFTYDKRLYDRLVHLDAAGVRAHLEGFTPEFHARCVRFVENHDEPRAQLALGVRHCPAALLCAAVPGMFLMHEGESEGRRKKTPVQINVRAREPVFHDVQNWYHRLLEELRHEPWRGGSFRLLPAREAWAGNPTHPNIIPILRRLDEAGETRLGLAVANIGHTQAQGYVDFAEGDLLGDWIYFRDLLTDVLYERSRRELRERGMFFDLKPGQSHLFRVEAQTPPLPSS